MIKLIYKYLSNASGFLLYLLLFLLPTQLGKHFFFPFSYLSGVRTDYLAPTLYSTDILVFLLILLNSKTVFSFFKKRSFLLLFLLSTFNIVFSLSPWISFYKVIKIAEFLSLFAIVQKFGNKLLPPKKLLIVLLASSAFQFILVALQFVHKHSLQGFFYFFGERYITLSLPGIAKVSLQGIELLRPYGTFSHPNSLAGFYLLIYFFVLTNKKFDKYLLLKNSILFFSFILIFLSFSKTSFFLYTYYLLLNT